MHSYVFFQFCNDRSALEIYMYMKYIKTVNRGRYFLDLKIVLDERLKWCISGIIQNMSFVVMWFNSTYKFWDSFPIKQGIPDIVVHLNTSFSIWKNSKTRLISTSKYWFPVATPMQIQTSTLKFKLVLYCLCISLESSSYSDC